MRPIDFYLDKAKENHGLKSDRELDRAIGFKGCGVSQIRTGRALPSDEAMIKLAEMARVDPEEALLELAYRRAASRDETRAASVYRALLDRVTHAAAALLIGFLAFSAMPTDASAMQNIRATSGQGSLPIYKLCDIRTRMGATGMPRVYKPSPRYPEPLPRPEADTADSRSGSPGQRLPPSSAANHRS